MAIISQQENFLLKFRQESSVSELQPISVSVVKENDVYIIELRGEKKNTSVTLDASSLREISQYIDSKIQIKSIQTTSPSSLHKTLRQDLPQSLCGIGMESDKMLGLGSIGTVSGDNVGSVADLINDISLNAEKTFYHSQADLIISNGVDTSSFS